jgi:hypothetical protein
MNQINDQKIKSKQNRYRVVKITNITTKPTPKIPTIHTQTPQANHHTPSIPPPQTESL